MFSPYGYDEDEYRRQHLYKRRVQQQLAQEQALREYYQQQALLEQQERRRQQHQLALEQERLRREKEAENVRRKRQQQQLQQQQQQQAHSTRKISRSPPKNVWMVRPKPATRTHSLFFNDFFPFQSPFFDNDKEEEETEDDFIRDDANVQQQPQPEKRSYPQDASDDEEDSTSVPTTYTKSSLKKSRTPSPAPTPSPTQRPFTPPKSPKMTTNNTTLATQAALLRKQAESAEKIQSWYRNLRTSQKSLKTINSLASQLTKLMPSTSTERQKRLQELTANCEIDPKSLTGKPRLLLGAKNNMPILELEEKFTRMMLAADSVESAGCDKVRDARRQLIRKVQKCLDEIESAKTEAVRRALHPSIVSTTGDGHTVAEVSEGLSAMVVDEQQEEQLEELENDVDRYMSGCEDNKDVEGQDNSDSESESDNDADDDNEEGDEDAMKSCSMMEL
jgi:hypothetical protein